MLNLVSGLVWSLSRENSKNAQPFYHFVQLKKIYPVHQQKRTKNLWIFFCEFHRPSGNTAAALHGRRVELSENISQNLWNNLTHQTFSTECLVDRNVKESSHKIKGVISTYRSHYFLSLSPFVFPPARWFIQKTNSSEVNQPMHTLYQWTGEVINQQ